MSRATKPIGIFDSGVGGLSIYRALRAKLPNENFIYLGDTARLPYGTKSAETVTQYTLQATRLLLEKDIKFLVVACNTASALALSELRQTFPNLPCIGVIEPGAAAAIMASEKGEIALLATEGTVQSGAYQTALQRHNTDIQLQAVACSLLVSLAEEGWTDGPVAEATVQRYLSMLDLKKCDTIILGCTHFPIFAPLFRRYLPTKIKIVDSALITANATFDFLSAKGLLNPSIRSDNDQFWVTDSPERFNRAAKIFLSDTSLPDANIIEAKPWNFKASPSTE